MPFLALKPTYPSGRILSYDGSASSNTLSRIDNILDTGITTLASYTYLGDDTVTQITYPEPGVWLDLWGGGSTWAMNGLDEYNRVIDQRWQNNITGTPTDIDRYQYGYDYDSNRLYKANVVGTAAVGNLDEGYTYDHLNRLTQMQRGTLSSGIISGTPVREMDYTLDPTGNWAAYITKTNGTTDLSQTRTANKVNEITAIGGTPAWATPPTYDPAGNMTSFPQPASPSSAFTATYDAWNRMTSISSGGTSVATYQYDGRGRRVVKYTASTSETRHFYYTNNWQNVEERIGTSTTVDKQYVWGLRYIDELVCRDDSTPQRLYAMQDANFNLTSIADTSSTIVERNRFDPYGNRNIMDESWTAIPATAFSWVTGYQGLVHDEECGLVYDRARYVNPVTGRMISREPFGGLYVDGLNLYQYVQSDPIKLVDPSGLGPIDWLTTGDWSPSAEETQAANSGWVEGWGNFGWWAGNDDSGSVGQWAYTGHWKSDPNTIAAAVQGAQQRADCATKCIACENKKVANWIAAMAASGVAYGATPRPIGLLIAGRGMVTGGFWKSGVRAVGLGLKNYLGVDGSMFTAEADAFKSASALGRTARIGAAGLALLETYIAQDCARKCMNNPQCYTCK